MSGTFKANTAGLSEFLHSNDLYRALTVHAAVIEARAKSTSHVESPASAASHQRAPGRFRDSIHTEKHESPSRVVARVVAGSPAAAAIEARDHTLGRAAG